MNKEGWEIKKLDDCFEFIRNGANIKQDPSAEGVPITRIETLSNDLFNRNKLGYANIFDISKYEKYILEDKDILMSHINSVKFLGRAVLYSKKQDETIIHGMNLLNLRSLQQVINPQFATYYFQSFDFKDKISKITKKAVNQASFTVSTLKEFLIPIPPLAIQEQIVAELDALNDIIAKKRQQLTELDTLAQATFYQMFGDPVENEKEWEVKRLEQVCAKITDGEHGTVERLNSGVLYLMARNITQNGILNLDEVSFISKENHQKIFKRCNPSFQDVLLVCVGATIGKSCLVPRMEEFSIARSVALLKPNKKYIVPYYLLAYTKCYYFKQQIQNSQHTAAQAGLYIGKIKDLKIPLPPLALQNQFAEQIEAIERQKELINQSIVEVQKLFDYIMDKYFN